MYAYLRHLGTHVPLTSLGLLELTVEECHTALHLSI
jgi:hypothetical protein